jgi:Double zinc ribbon
MSRFEQEWALVPTAARVIAVLAPLPLVALMALIFVAGPLSAGETPPLPVWGFFLLTSVLPGIGIAVFVLLVGYVWADAGRRGMNPLGWTLIAIFVPGAVGLILYFLLRDPVPVPCPSCRTPVAKGLAFCSSCGAPVRRACPQCRQPVEPTWTHCGRCGAALAAATPFAESPSP